MLGYVNVAKKALSEEDYNVYKAYYCGVCKSIGERYGQIPRMALSYDAVFLAMVLACGIKVGGYYVAEGIIYGNWIAPVVSIPANIIQVALGAVVTLIVIKPLQLAADKTLHRV